jgi:hypothetical protein
VRAFVNVVSEELQTLESTFLCCEESDWEGLTQVISTALLLSSPSSSGEVAINSSLFPPIFLRRNRQGGVLLHAICQHSTPAFLSSFLDTYAHNPTPIATTTVGAEGGMLLLTEPCNHLPDSSAAAPLVLIRDQIVSSLRCRDRSGRTPLDIAILRGEGFVEGKQILERFESSSCVSQ